MVLTWVCEIPVKFRVFLIGDDFFVFIEPLCSEDVLVVEGVVGGEFVAGAFETLLIFRSFRHTPTVHPSPEGFVPLSG